MSKHPWEKSAHDAGKKLGENAVRWMFGLPSRTPPLKSTPKIETEPSAEVLELKKQTRMMAEEKAQVATYAGAILGIFVSVGLFSWLGEAVHWAIYLAPPIVCGWLAYKYEYARLTN